MLSLTLIVVNMIWDVFSDFPLERVPIILSPLLYPEIEDVPLKKLEDIANMPKSVVSSETNR